MKQYYIYLTTHTTNNKKYIGQHYGELDDNYYGSGAIISKILASEGTKNLQKDILCICANREEADIKEKEYIAYYNAVESDEYYNLSEGGTGGDGWRAWRAWTINHPKEAKQIYQQNGERLQTWISQHPEEYHKKAIRPMIEGAKLWKQEHPERVAEIMRNGNKAKEEWQQTHKEQHKAQVEKWRKAGSEANSKQVHCITTDAIFESLSAAAREYAQYGVRQGNLSKVLKGERKTCGSIDGIRLTWELI